MYTVWSNNSVVDADDDGFIEKLQKPIYIFGSENANDPTALFNAHLDNTYTPTKFSECETDDELHTNHCIRIYLFF